MSVRKGIVVAVHGLLNFPTCILICIIGDRWLQAAGIFAQTKRVSILPVVPTASCLLMDGNPKMILSKCFLLSLPLWVFLTLSVMSITDDLRIAPSSCLPAKSQRLLDPRNHELPRRLLASRHSPRHPKHLLLIWTIRRTRAS